MSNLDLNIVRKGSKTHTTFRMKWYETSSFRNWDLEFPLDVTIQPEPSIGPLCSLSRRTWRRSYHSSTSRQHGACDTYGV